jgi:hypothetical protein
MTMKRTKTELIRQRLKSLTEGTARRMEEVKELTNSIKRYKPSTTKPRSPLNFNKEKLLEKSRCYTETTSVYEQPQEHSIFLSQSPIHT